MGGVSSVCEAWFEESTTLRKSSLNPKYTNEKRHTTNTSKGPRNTSMNDSPLKTEANSSASKSKGHSLSMDDFSIVKVLGRGSYGKIFLVQKKTNKKYYALKVIKKHDLNKPGLRQNILTEKDVLMQARHPFIVRLKYAFQNESRIYMVMDFCQGGELFLRLKRAGKFDEEAVKFYTAEVILALQYLHEKLNIIHRDLKPENILLCSDGHIKVTDFGLSKVTNRTYSICGTPEYIAPEVILRQGYGKLVDWWSLGCLMFEMMTGSPPFSSEDRDELSNDILLKNAKLPKDMSEEAKDLISSLLAKDPAQRLGVNGIEEIKEHPFFKNIDWDAIMKKKVKPPFVPEVKGNEDVSNFYKTYTNEPPKETPILKPKILDSRADDFPSFSYLDDTMSELPSMSHVDKDNILGSIMEDERKLSVKLE